MRYSCMKNVVYTSSARADLKRHQSIAKRIVAKIDAYAATGAGDIKRWDRVTRLRVTDFRVIFEETADEIIVTKIGPRGTVYE
jgi:mRNA interferase RelE/StbE